VIKEYLKDVDNSTSCEYNELVDLSTSLFALMRKLQEGDFMLERFEMFTTAISSIYRYVQKIEREEMEKYGLKGAHAQYLVAMDHYPEGITAAKLCEVCDIDKAAVSRVLSKMEKKKLVERSGDVGYRARVRLTDEGKAAALFVAKRATLAVEMAGKGLSDEDRKTFYEALELIAANILTLSKDGIPES